MVRIIKYFFCLCSILFYYSVQAQDTLIEEGPSLVVPADSYDTEVTPGYEDRKEFGFFDSVPKFNERKLDENALNRVKNDDAYWYANMELPPKKNEKKKEIVVEKSGWFNALFWILLVGAFVALLVWLLSGSNISLFRRSADEIETNEEEPAENIFELNFDKEIQAAIASGNYRLGVRLMYLQVLRMMADRGMIRYTAEKTNSDYMFQLASTKYYKDFSKLTRNFDYIWYGKFPVTPDSFGVLQKDFSSFKQSLG